MYNKVVASQFFSSSKAFKQMCSSFLSDEGSLKILSEVDFSIFLIKIESLNILLIETSSLFLLSKIPLNETSSPSSFVEASIFLDEVSPLSDEESYKDRSSTEIFLSKKFVGVYFSYYYLKEFFDEVYNDLSRFIDLIHSSFNS